MKLTGTEYRATLTVNGKRCGVTVSKGPWIAGVDPRTIKLRAKKGYFPTEVKAAFSVENNSDILTDYFEGDSMRLLPGHPLYDLAAAI
jgi:hypothetical protein